MEEQGKYIEANKQNWSKVSHDELLNMSFNVNWSYTSENLNSQAMWEELHGKLMNIASKVPNSCVKVGPDGEPYKKPWSCSALQRKLRKKVKQWAIFDAEPTPVNLNLALCYQSEYEKVEIKSKVKYEKKVTKNLKKNSKAFFSYMRSKRKIKTTVTALSRPDGTKTDGPLDTANLLAESFSSVFLTEPLGPLQQQCTQTKEGMYNISEVDICDSDIRDKLSKLNIYKSYGPDDCHPKLLKALADNPQFVKAIGDLFRCCAASGEIPLIWKSANVIPLFKKGSKSDPLNYRPVSLTSIICKVYEQFIREHILNHVESHITDKQHGFIGGRSCLSNMWDTVDTILDMLANGAPVDVLYLDFCKAFDTVPHYRLLAKLESYGITGKTLAIVRDFLTGRSMRVTVGGKISEAHYVTSGVPQGSVLGPLLFVLFVNDLPQNLRNPISLFADDLKIIGNANNECDINNDLYMLERWEDMWLLRFNPSKCKVLHINKNNNPMNNYKLDGVNLTTVESECDLGLHTNSQFDWSENIKQAIIKANRMTAWVVRNIIDRSCEVMLLIYKALIRPHLEYCVQIWSPTACRGNWDILLQLENVQRKYTRLIEGIGTLSYGDRLQQLKLTTLAERRVRGDLIETFKIVSGSVNYGQSLFKISRSGYNLVSMLAVGKNDNYRRDFFANRVISYWNDLPLKVKLSKTVDQFKCKLDEYKKSSTNIMGNYWEVSVEILRRIESKSSPAARSAHIDYLKDNPWVARARGINLK